MQHFWCTRRHVILTLNVLLSDAHFSMLWQFIKNGTAFMSNHCRTLFERHSTFMSGAVSDFFSPQVKLIKKPQPHSDNKYLNHPKSQGKKK